MEELKAHRLGSQAHDCYLLFLQRPIFVPAHMSVFQIPVPGFEGPAERGAISRGWFSVAFKGQ